MQETNRESQTRPEQTEEQQASRRNPADNLTREARIRGGMHSAKQQQRDAFGQFAGRKGTTGEDMSRTVRGRRARGRPEPPAGGSEESTGQSEHRPT